MELKNLTLQQGSQFSDAGGAQSFSRDCGKLIASYLSVLWDTVLATENDISPPFHYSESRKLLATT